ncbi:MAG: hypothetical protein LLF76_13090 [Planctomycetaceae bacterium]|nr:hypothetical protein [Planctomycetaceae bacterium]
MEQFLIIKPVAPFRLDLTAWVLRRRVGNIIDQWNDGTYRRVLVVGGKRIGIAVRQGGTPDKPSLRVKLSGRNLDTAAKSAVKHTAERMLGTQINLEPFYAFAARDETLGPIVQKYTGFKPPQFQSVFEAAVNGICCQQLSLDVGIILLNRLTMACSKQADNGGVRMYSFPTPRQVADMEMQDLRKLGFSTNKARALINLAVQVIDGGMQTEELDALDDQEAISRLLAMRGIGRWTAEYVLLRGLGRLHIYPGEDSGFSGGLKRWLSLEGKMDRAVVQQVMSRWPRYGGMVYFHLLMERLYREKLIA